ncbi:MAG: sugar ABC transporter ATP-binding protein [Lachnospiraceae bacterium]|nr:sugar ABC transporter ATP-binding protein [Lachnospiraceae bacterium]
MEKRTLLSMRNISKQYPGVLALDRVSLDIYEGETHALVGENGAGKSTFIKVLAGAIRPDEGEIELDGQTYSHITPALARHLGIEVIYQEFNLMPTLSVAENVFMGNYPKRYGIIDHREMERRTDEIFQSMGVRIDPRAAVSGLSMAYMQLVEIAKALAKKVRILIMDEPTAPLTAGEVEVLFQLMDKLHRQGVTIIYISHRLNEIFRVTERLTVIRDGCKIGTFRTGEMTREQLICQMVGRELNETFPRNTARTEEVALKVEDLSGNGVEDISFELHRGEILGFGGLVGAGRTEIMRVLSGVDARTGGRAWLEGKELSMKSPRISIREGIALIPEDRKRQGVVLSLPILENVILPNLKLVTKYSVINRRKEGALVSEQMKALRIAAPSMRQLAGNLSGGNQQKVVLAKWLLSRSRVLIFDEPTRGIDVGAKQEIYKLMCALCEQGASIIMISSEMEELLGMSDRIVVLCEGRQEGILKREDFSQEAVLALASGNQ